MPMVLLGNKGDMVHLRQVSSEEGNGNGSDFGGYGNGNIVGGYSSVNEDGNTNGASGQIRWPRWQWW